MSHVVIECGSSARGDTNKNSDIDIVCIWTETPPDYCRIKEKHGDVIFYSTDTIDKMMNKGALFLVHLDIDGRYIEGNRSLINKIKDFKPSPESLYKSYSESKDFIKKLSWFPNSNIGRLWLMDALYVALRNCIYCQNAINGIYKFGYTSALTSFSLNGSDIGILLAIREGKYRYRNGSDISNILDTNDIKTVCEKIINSDVTFNCGGNTNWNRDWKFDYWDERWIERSIINGEHNDTRFTDKMKDHNYNRACLKREIKYIVEVHQDR